MCSSLTKVELSRFLFSHLQQLAAKKRIADYTLTDGGKTTGKLLFMYGVIYFVVPNYYFELFLNQNVFLTTINLKVLLLNNFFWGNN